MEKKNTKLNIAASQTLDEQKKLLLSYREEADAHLYAVKSSLRNFLTTGLFVIALVTVFLATFAWFANNEMVSGRGNSLNAEVNLLEAGDYDIYKASDEAGSSFVKYSFTEENAGTIPQVNLNAYDAVLDSNPYTSLYFRIPVYSKDLNDENVTGLEFVIDCDAAARWIGSQDAQSTNLPYLSSIIQLKCYAFPELDDTMPADNEAEYVYTYLKTKFEEIPDLKQYVDADAQLPVYTTKQLTYDIPKKSADNPAGYVAKQRADGNFETYVYVEMDYSPKLVAEYLGLNNSHIELGQQINIDSFLQDIILMKFSLKKTGTN